MVATTRAFSGKLPPLCPVRQDLALAGLALLRALVRPPLRPWTSMTQERGEAQVRQDLQLDPRLLRGLMRVRRRLVRQDLADNRHARLSLRRVVRGRRLSMIRSGHHG